MRNRRMEIFKRQFHLSTTERQQLCRNHGFVPEIHRLAWYHYPFHGTASIKVLANCVHDQQLPDFGTEQKKAENRRKILK